MDLSGIVVQIKLLVFSDLFLLNYLIFSILLPCGVRNLGQEKSKFSFFNYKTPRVSCVQLWCQNAERPSWWNGWMWAALRCEMIRMQRLHPPELFVLCIPLIFTSINHTIVSFNDEGLCSEVWWWRRCICMCWIKTCKNMMKYKSVCW